MIHRRLVVRKKYLSEEELLEINALCQMLPGPSSTQTLTSIGYKLGGPFLALMTLLVWIFPATVLMTLIVLSFNFFDKRAIDTTHIFRFLQPLAVGFIASAAYRITRNTIKNPLTFLVITVSAVLCCVIPSPFLFPALIIAGGCVSYFTSRSVRSYRKPIIVVNWNYPVLFVSIFILAGILALATRFKPIVLFENTYRFGSLVFGGGNVLIPMMYEQFVVFKKTIAVSREDFITGVGLVQLIPGPVFSFATYMGGMSMRSGGWVMQIFGSLVATIGIFLPGILIIFFIYPLWDQVKSHPVISKSLEGINAAAAGFVIAAAVLLFMSIGFTPLNIGIIIASTLLLVLTRIPSPFLVALAIILGIFL